MPTLDSLRPTRYNYPTMLTPFNEGNYEFLPGSATFSSGARAVRGYAMVRASFFRVLPLAQAFAAMQQHLAGLGRPMTAVAGIELRSPKPFSFAGFGGFNKGYIELLQQYGLQSAEGKGVAARSNLAPEPLSIAPSEPGVLAFCYTVPGNPARPQFVAAGSGELRPAASGGSGAATSPRDLIVRLGETSPDAMREKAIYCMNAVADELKGLGVGWEDCTGVNLYTVHSMDSYLVNDILKPIGATGIQGVHWYYTRPPIEEIEFEVDARGVSQEIIL